MNEEKTASSRMGVYNLLESFPHEIKLSIQILCPLTMISFLGKKPILKSIKELMSACITQTAASHPNLFSLLLLYFVAQYVLIIVV